MLSKLLVEHRTNCALPRAGLPTIAALLESAKQSHPSDSSRGPLEAALTPVTHVCCCSPWAPCLYSFSNTSPFTSQCEPCRLVFLGATEAWPSVLVESQCHTTGDRIVCFVSGFHPRGGYRDLDPELWMRGMLAFLAFLP